MQWHIFFCRAGFRSSVHKDPYSCNQPTRVLPVPIWTPLQPVLLRWSTPLKTFQLVSPVHGSSCVISVPCYEQSFSHKRCMYTAFPLYGLWCVFSALCWWQTPSRTTYSHKVSPPYALGRDWWETNDERTLSHSVHSCTASPQCEFGCASSGLRCVWNFSRRWHKYGASGLCEFSCEWCSLSDS